MAITTKILAGDVADMIGGDFVDYDKVYLWIEWNLEEGQAVLDTANNKIRLGSSNITVNSDGTWSRVGLITFDSADVQPTELLYRVHWQYPDDHVTGGRATGNSGWLKLMNADPSTVQLTAAMVVDYVPASWMTDAIATLQTYVDAGLAAETGAEAAQAAAEAAITGLGVGTTTTGAPGTPASVTLTGTAPDRDFNFTIPEGEQGLPGPGAAAWTATQAVTVGSVRQAPDGSWIKSTADRTTRSSFDATEQGFWATTSATSGTLEQLALSATFVRPVGSGVARFIRRAQAGQALKIVGVGDSVTAGTGSTVGTNDFLTLVKNDLGTRFPSATITQSNRGSSGTTVATHVINGVFASAITDAGDMYLLSFAKNDTVADSNPSVPLQGYLLAQSIRGLEVMIRRIRTKVPKADIMVVAENPNTSTDTAGNALLQAWNVEARILADAYGCEWVDCYAAFVAKGNYSSYLSDSVHPSVTGHRLIADTVLASIPDAPVTAVPLSAMPTLGVKAVSEIDADLGYNGWTVVQATGATKSGSWLNTGTWTGPNPYVTTTANDYAEFKFQGTELMVRFSTSVADALVADITIDGVTTAGVSMVGVGSAFQPFLLLAKGLTPGNHTVRVKLVSGTMRIYQAAWLNARIVADALPGIRQFLSGRYYATEPYVPTTNNPAVGTGMVVPFFVPYSKGFNEIAVDVTNAQAGATINLGIYGSGDGDQPYGLIVDAGSVSGATTGFKTIAISQLLTPGWYWLAYLALVAAPSVRANQCSHPLCVSSATSTQFAFNGYSVTGLTALPAIWTSTTAAVASPRLMLKPS